MKTRRSIDYSPHSSNAAARHADNIGLLDNTQLISRSAWDAYQSRDYEVCDALLARYEARRPLPAELLTLRGQSLMAQDRMDEAVQTLQVAAATGSDPTVSYQLACAHARLGCHEQVLVLVDEETMRDVPKAIPLKMLALHRLGRLDDAIELGMDTQTHAVLAQEIRGLLANLLIDADRCSEARTFARFAQGTADGCTAEGLLALDALNLRQALMSFRQAVSHNPRSGRAWLGEGLCQLGLENHRAATTCFDEATTLLVRDAGVWTVAAWVHLLNQGISQARTRFERARHVDNGFAEAHGGLAIICLYEGNIDDAGVHAEQALQLNRHCLAGALARSILMARMGDFPAAQRVRESMALHPLGRDGLSIAKGLARRAMRHAYPC